VVARQVYALVGDRLADWGRVVRMMEEEEEEEEEEEQRSVVCKCVKRLCGNE